MFSDERSVDQKIKYSYKNFNSKKKLTLSKMELTV